jgi:RimJ/RimL family protein N-acetyltransferase
VILWAWHDDSNYGPLLEFITTRIWGCQRAMTDGTVMAVTEGGQIIGACLFHNWQPEDGVIELTSASISPRWLSRSVLRAMFGYAFDRLGCQLAVMRVSPENQRMCRIAERFGFKRYDIPRLRGRDKPEAIFILGDDEWRSGKFS